MTNIGRRNFIKTATAATVVAPFVSGEVLAEKNPLRLLLFTAPTFPK
jgi:hypothetical protein